MAVLVAVGFLLFGVLGRFDGKVLAAYWSRRRSADPALKVVVEFSALARSDFPCPLPEPDLPCPFLVQLDISEAHWYHAWARRARS